VKQLISVVRGQYTVFVFLCVENELQIQPLVEMWLNPVITTSVYMALRL
jgi:hypothetical protein